jgi:hypothetical protein
VKYNGKPKRAVPLFDSMEAINDNGPGRPGSNELPTKLTATVVSYCSNKIEPPSMVAGNELFLLAVILFVL